MTKPQVATAVWGDEELIDLEELTALALSADPDPIIDPLAKPFTALAASSAGSTLPEWYMPGVAARFHPTWRKWAIVTIVALLVAIEFSGLCSAFGQLVAG